MTHDEIVEQVTHLKIVGYVNLLLTAIVLGKLFGLTPKDIFVAILQGLLGLG